MGSAEEYPVNKSLLKIKERKEKKMAGSKEALKVTPASVVEKTPEAKFTLPKVASPVPVVDMCPIYNKPLDLVCI